MGVGWILLIAMVVLLILQVPVGIAIGFSTFIAVLYHGGLQDIFVAQSLVQGVNSFPIMAIPLFILAGELMGAGGISKRILEVANIFFGHITGGLAIVTVVVTMFFATVSGSGPATVAAVGSMVVPTMLKHGYNKSFTLALVAAAGTIGVILPPSIPMVIFGVSTGASIASMFLGGILPGLLVGLTLMVYAYAYGRKHNIRTGERQPLSKGFKAMWDAKWALINPLIILGGIYAGIFTPTEAAAVAVFYAFICGFFVYKELKIEMLFETLKSSCITIGTVLIILGGATAFARLLTLENIPNQLAAALTGVTDNRILMILLINVFLLVIGKVLDTIPAIMILAPILLPVAMEIGMHPVQFGVIMIINKAIGFLTPPLAINVFVAARVGNTTAGEVNKGIWPFIGIMFALLLIVSYVPWFTLAFVD